MSHRRRSILALVLVLVLAFGAVAGTGCTKTPAQGGSGEPKAEGPQKGGTLNFYIGQPTSIDPVNSQESEGIQVCQALFDGLVDFDFVTSEIKPAVAESWESSQEGKVWTFKLRKGVKFHNGREVTAADFKYAWERIANPDNKSEIAYHLTPIQGYAEMTAEDAAKRAKEMSGLKVVDPYTLEVTLTEPFAEFEMVVGHPALGPVPKEEVEKGADAFFKMPVGNGPFKMTEPWKDDQYIKTAAFADYYGTKPNIEGIEFKIFKDEQTSFLEFQADRVDFTKIPPNQIKPTKEQYGESSDGYTGNPGKQVLLGAETAIYYLAMNNADQYLKNPDLRKAISLAINRQGLVDTVYEGTRKPADGMVPPSIPGYAPGAFPYAKYDVEQAKQLLAKAGYPEGKGLPELKLTINAGSGHEDVAEFIKEDLAKVGIKAKVDGVESAEFWNLMQGGKYQMGRDGWIGDYPVWDNFLYPAFFSKNIDADNHSRYSNPKVDAGLMEARKIADAKERQAKYAEVQKTVGEDAPVAPLNFYAHRHVVSKRTHDLVYSPLGLTDFTKVWLEQ